MSTLKKSDQPLLLALQGIDTNNPSSYLLGVMDMFTRINSMNEQGIISAWQAYKLLVDLNKVDDETFEKLVKVEDAMIARMIFLCSQVSKENRAATARAFIEVVDVRDHAFKFKGVINS